IKVDDAMKVVDVLRIGRVALLYLTPDGGETGGWDAAGKQWHVFPGSYRNAVREAIRIALERAAPEILTLPVPAPAGGNTHASRDDRMEKLVALLGTAMAGLIPAAQAQEPAGDTETLLKQIHAAAQEDAQVNQQRLQRFVADKAQQQTQLAE